MKTASEAAHANLALAFNEWMRRYIEDPDGFASAWASVKRSLAEQANGEEQSYGANCAAYICDLMAELRAAGKCETAEEPPVVPV